MNTCDILENQVKEETYDKVKKKVKEGLDTAKKTTMAAVEWGSENKEFLALMIPLALYGVKKIDKHRSLTKEARLKDSYIYDRSMGMYLESTKPLTTAQKLDVDAMHKAGMSYAEIGKKLGIKWK